jgi:F-type H+-transporting ATPase subunit b
MRVTKAKVLPAAALFVLTGAAFAFASGGGEGEGFSFWGFFWQVVNFAVLVTALVIFGRKPIRDFFRNRTEMIKKSLDEARQARELAEKALAEVEDRLKTKDREIEEMMATAEQAGKKEREAIILEGERLSQKLVEQARTNIDFELRQAREAIKAEAVELAMELAEKKIQGKLSDEDQRRLFEEALSRLEKKS